MPVIRGHHNFDDKYAQIPNHFLRDSRLSLKAIGLLAQLMSHSPGWNVSIRTLALSNKVSRDQITSAMKELEKLGYISRSQQRDGTRFAEAVYTTRDPFTEAELAATELSAAEFPSTEKSATENPTTKNTNSKEQQLKEKQTKNEYAESFELFWKLYPRKENKPKAAKEFSKLVSEQELIMQKLNVWLIHPVKVDRGYWPHAERWLRDRRFDDELTGSQNAPSRKIVGDF
jgi:DNA-binding MarR family transcriptional regulator